MMLSRILILLMCVVSGHLWNVVTKSKGGVWPMPQYHYSESSFLSVEESSFKFVYNGSKCQILNDAFERYYNLIFKPSRLPGKDQKSTTKTTEFYNNYVGSINHLNIYLSGDCETWPYFGMQENYTLIILENGEASLNSSKVWGILRGLETFSQLTYRDEYLNIYVNLTLILDYPRFPHRGIMLDTSRHYVPKAVILQNLDAMAFSKYNVFHWHIVDDESFPYQSTSYPSLSQNGAFVPSTHIYTLKDVTQIIEYARQRGIRVVVEFDTPAHMASWGLGIPSLLTPCFKSECGKLVNNGYGPINPTLNSTYSFLEEFFAEITDLFPDSYIHLGGDEVSFDCWASNPNIQDFMKLMNFSSDYDLLQNYYFNKLFRVVTGHTRNMASLKTPIVWQEVFDSGVDLSLDSVIHVWRENSMQELKNVTASGYRALLSSCWYLSDFDMANDWVTFYPCEPLAFNGTKEENSKVIGGEACLWGEFVDSTNLITRLWPRALAPAERLWSDQIVNDHTVATPRFEEHRCRMVERGINAEPVNGPSFCMSDYLV